MVRYLKVHHFTMPSPVIGLCFPATVPGCYLQDARLGECFIRKIFDSTTTFIGLEGRVGIDGGGPIHPTLSYSSFLYAARYNLTHLNRVTNPIQAAWIPGWLCCLRVYTTCTSARCFVKEQQAEKRNRIEIDNQRRLHKTPHKAANYLSTSVNHQSVVPAQIAEMLKAEKMLELVE